MKSVETKNAPEAVGPFSQAITHEGMIYVSGCLGLDPSTRKLVSENVEEQGLFILLTSRFC
jgi:2-iminobutanoate/2-iminopropanoate deaminase